MRYAIVSQLLSSYYYNNNNNKNTKNNNNQRNPPTQILELYLLYTYNLMFLLT